MDDATLAWPFFTDEHRSFARELGAWTLGELANGKADNDVDDACRALVGQLGDAGWLRHCVPAEYGGAHERLDVTSLCIARESLSRVSGLADFAFAMQGLASGPISMYGSPELKAKYLPRVVTGQAIAAFAISESDAGSDLAAMRTTARLDGDHYVIDGEKTWISNGGIADQYVVFCRLGDAERAFIALVVEPGDPGFAVSERITTIAPHPLATLRFESCRVPANRVVGEPGKGLRIALGTLDVFRSTVGAAALGMARRALDETLAHVTARKMFGQLSSDFQLTQARIAGMATAIAMAKSFATEAAQRVIDDAVQLLGARGVVSGSPVEQLYREIRALRIYEGATEVQHLIIAGQVLAEYAKKN
jgi:acyl-CoA dehydrogenase